MQDENGTSGLFDPSRVAVVGATDRDGAVGRAILTNLDAFDGDVVAVNPTREEVLGYPCYSDLASVPEPVDLAVVVVPPGAVADLLETDVVLLARYHESRDLDDVLAAVDAFGDRLRGVVFNAVADADYDTVTEEVAPFLDARGVPVLGVLPRVQDLAGVTIGDLADELGGRIVADGNDDAFVERFLVGAMSGDAALTHFRRTKDAAVITGGDRADIQTAALDAPGVKALVLTGGYEPSGAVAGRAEQEGVPIIVVDSDTLSAVDRAEAVVSGGRTRDEWTVKRMRDLLAEHADVDALLGE